MFNHTFAITTKMRTAIAAVLVAVPVLAMPSASLALVNDNGYQSSHEALIAKVNAAVCGPVLTIATTGAIQSSPGSVRPPTMPSVGGPTMPLGSDGIPQECQS